MKTAKDAFIQEVKNNSLAHLLVPIQNIKYLSYDDIVKALSKEGKKINAKNLEPFSKLYDSTYTMLDLLSKQFYINCKERLYTNLKASKTTPKALSHSDFLDQLFTYIESNYQKPYYSLLFLKNSLGFVGATAFLNGTDMIIDLETQVFIELRTGIIEEMVRCFSFCEV